MLESENNQILILKDNLILIKNYIFYVRNSEPSSGIINSQTYLSIENKEILNITKLNIAIVIFDSNSDKIINDKRTYEEYILKAYFNPFFLSGIKKYIERGDTFQIENLEMFVLNSYPDHGYINSETIVSFTFGLNKEECLNKIKEADNQFAMNLIRLEDRLSEDELIK